MKLHHAVPSCMTLLATILAGCAGGVPARATQPQPVAKVVPAGEARLRITATIKTHKPGVYGAKDIHGTDDYRLLVDVDGRGTRLAATLSTGKNAVTYRFAENLALEPGTHRIKISLPGEAVAREREFVLADGESAALVVEPVYGRSSEKRRPSACRPEYLNGVTGFRVLMNGRYI